MSVWPPNSLLYSFIDEIVLPFQKLNQNPQHKQEQQQQQQQQQNSLVN